MNVKGIFGTLRQILAEVSFVFLAICQMNLPVFFFSTLGTGGAGKRLYFVSRFIVLFCPAFIFRQKESDLEVNIPGALQGGEF